jgi:hypothetical protein
MPTKGGPPPLPAPERRILRPAIAERQAQLCVYHRGERVVDLWADKIGDSNYSADSIANVFSSSKSLEAIAVAYLVDRGQISYDAKVTEYWPEFGANGKEGITVADVMRHEAGMATFDSRVDMEELLTDKLNQNSVGRIFQQQGLNYDGAGDGKREHHGFARGWIINEVFRRAEPSGRTIGEFLRDEISGPLNAGVIIGVREEQMSKRIQVKALGAFVNTRFSQGGVNFSLPTTSSSTTLERDMNDGCEGFIGWAGFRGSIFQWHPELDIGFAFMPTYLHVIDLFYDRGKRYQAQVLKCVKAREAAS